MPYSIKDIKSEIQKFGKSRFIRAELLKRGYTLKDVARQLNLSDSTIQMVIDDRGKSRRVASHIENLLEVPRGTLFEYLKEEK